MIALWTDDRIYDLAPMLALWDAMAKRSTRRVAPGIDPLAKRRPYAGQGVARRLIELLNGVPLRYMEPALPAWF